MSSPFWARWSRLSRSQQQLVIEMVELLEEPIESQIGRASDICSSEFAEDFQNRLVMHHGVSEEPLKKALFEFAFVHPNEKSGREARLVQSPVNPGSDAVVDGVSFPLKTEAAKTIRKPLITISKLMEARWIRECRSGDDFLEGVRTHILLHLRQYERILMLRAFTESDRWVEYYLVEIPLDLLMQVKTVSSSDFSTRTVNGSSTANVVVDGGKAFSLRLDGSVEKVTISGLDIRLCTFHSYWKIPTRAPI